MYEIFERLLKRDNVTPYRVYKETGVPQSTLSDWKKDGRTPGAEHLKKIAAYFNVTVDYLLGGEQKNAPAPEGERKRIVDEDIMFAFWGGDSREMSKEDLEDVRRYAEFVRQRKKAQNK